MQGMEQFLWHIWQFLGWNGLSTIATIISTATTFIVAFILPSKDAKKCSLHTKNHIKTQ